jgi:hypothetical protein
MTMMAISCTDPTPHDMLTVINADGSCYREFCLNADSNSLKPDTGNQIGLTKKLISKLPIIPDVTWSVHLVDQRRLHRRTATVFESNAYDSVLEG